jgi:uncharacterized membrane protein
MKNYIIIFFACSFLGWLYESILNKRPVYMKLSDKYEIKLPILNAYGIVAVILFILNKYMKHINIYLRAFIYTIICTFSECIIGKISYLINKNSVWVYPDFYHPTCDGYVSLYASVIWYLLIFIFIRGIDYFNLQLL